MKINHDKILCNMGCIAYKSTTIEEFHEALESSINWLYITRVN